MTVPIPFRGGAVHNACQGKQGTGGATVDKSNSVKATAPADYWRRLRALTLLLLAAWAAVTFAAPWFARDLNHLRFAGMPLGLWMSSQGAIAIYLLLIVVYAVCSDRLERRLGATPLAGDRPRHE